MEGQQRIELKIPSNYIYVSPIRAFVKQLAQQLEFSQMKVGDIGAAVDEACNNAIEHGSRGVNSNIILILTLNDDCLEILIRDRGKSKQAVSWLKSGRLEEVEKKMSPEGERGHGIFLIKTLSDRVDMEPNAHGGTDVRVTFLRKSPSAEAGNSIADCGFSIKTKRKHGENIDTNL